MKLHQWFILIGTVALVGLVLTMWSQYCYERGYDAGSEAAVFDA